jgi:transposase
LKRAATETRSNPIKISRKVRSRSVRQTSKPIVQMARDLGINDEATGNRVNADRRRQTGDAPIFMFWLGTLSEDERAELARLRRENAELQDAT